MRSFSKMSQMYYLLTSWYSKDIIFLDIKVLNIEVIAYITSVNLRLTKFHKLQLLTKFTHVSVNFLLYSYFSCIQQNVLWKVIISILETCPLTILTLMLLRFQAVVLDLTHSLILDPILSIPFSYYLIIST